MPDGRTILYFDWPDDAGRAATGGTAAAGEAPTPGPDARPAPVESDPIPEDD